MGKGAGMPVGPWLGQGVARGYRSEAERSGMAGHADGGAVLCTAWVDDPVRG